MMRHHMDDEMLRKVAGEIHGLYSQVNPPVPNPAPLGLFAFGLTTALLQVKHTRIGGSDPEDLAGVETFVLGFAMFFGGLLQIIAGLSEVKRNNIFGYTAFLLFGGFWLSIGTVDIIQLVAGNATKPNPKAVQALLFLVGVYATILWICTFKLNKTLNLLFFLLSVTLFLLCAGVQNEVIDQIGGWFGLATSALAYWLAAAELFNDIHGEGKKEIIPLGHFKWNELGAHGGGMQVPGRIQAAPLQRHQSSNRLFASARNLFHIPVVHKEEPKNESPASTVSSPILEENKSVDNNGDIEEGSVVDA